MHLELIGYIKSGLTKEDLLCFNKTLELDLSSDALSGYSKLIKKSLDGSFSCLESLPEFPNEKAESVFNSISILEKNIINLQKYREAIIESNISISDVFFKNYTKYIEMFKSIVVSLNIAILLSIGQKSIKVYLDDIRETPDGFVRAYWPEDIKRYEIFCCIEELSLDHDLGDDDKGTGYDAVLFFEEKVYFDRNYKAPLIKVHSSNSSAKEKMLSGIFNINEMLKRKE